jgi:hypothetical protein
MHQVKNCNSDNFAINLNVPFKEGPKSQRALNHNEGVLSKLKFDLKPENKMGDDMVIKEILITDRKGKEEELQEEKLLKQEKEVNVRQLRESFEVPTDQQQKIIVLFRGLTKPLNQELSIEEIELFINRYININIQKVLYLKE